MVKKGQAKGGKPGSGASATKGTVASNTSDDSFIVFSNSEREPKPKTKKPTDSNDVSDGDTRQRGSSGPALTGEAVKRPDIKKLIGGASWTGKLPVNLLSEHCQKQKWEKPEYTMVIYTYSLNIKRSFS